jgi:hypothetical protein
MHELLDKGGSGYVYAGDDYAPGSFVREAAEVLGPGDVVAGGTDAVRWALFQMSGARLAHYDDVRLDGNDVRIRYAELAERWDATVANDGFVPTHVVVPAFASTNGGSGTSPLPRGP